MEKFKLRELPIKDLKDHPKNPRYIKKEQFERLSHMIEKYGLIDKPIVNADMTIIGGHQRIRVLKKKKVKFVECWVSEEQLSDDDVDELMIGMNKIHGQFDYDILANEFDALNLLNLGFSEDELLGIYSDKKDGSSDKDENAQKSKKKIKTCPSCGCEF